jgi:hypothetical protein
MALPMPRLAPVTRATRPERVFIEETPLSRTNEKG